MSRRTFEPSERVAEILDESRDPRPLELPSTLAGGRYGVSRQAIVGVPGFHFFRKRGEAKLD